MGKYPPPYFSRISGSVRRWARSLTTFGPPAFHWKTLVSRSGSSLCASMVRRDGANVGLVQITIQQKTSSCFYFGERFFVPDGILNGSSVCTAPAQEKAPSLVSHPARRSPQERVDGVRAHATDIYASIMRDTVNTKRLVHFSVAKYCCWGQPDCGWWCDRLRAYYCSSEHQRFLCQSRRILVHPLVHKILPGISHTAARPLNMGSKLNSM